MDSTVSPPDKDLMVKLVWFLEADVRFGPGHERKRNQAGLQNRLQHFPISSVSPPLLTNRVQSFYMDNWISPLAAVNLGVKKSTKTLGGTPITLETAIELRKVVYGSAIHSLSRDWQKSTLGFCSLEGPFAYGIHTLKCGSRSLALCVQGFLLKQLIFDREYKSSILQGVGALSPSEFERRRALIGAICEMLWQAGEKKKCCVCLKEEDVCFGPDFRYRPDSVTETLHIFEFKKYEDLQNFVKRNLEQFQSPQGNGCILFLYSLVLSRTIQKVYEDMQADHGTKMKLLSDAEDVSQSLLNLALTGKATPYTHNGDLLYDGRNGLLLPCPLHGIHARNQIGFLFWDKAEDPERRTEIGSMLKTPKNPIWVTKVNGVPGLLFSLNEDLVSDWRVENRFSMFYYTGLTSQIRPTILSIETRIGRPRPKTAFGCKDEQSKIPALENCIMTKWFGAAVNWNGTLPFI